MVCGNTVKETLKRSFSELKNCSETPELDGEILLAKVLNVQRFDLFLKYDDLLSEEQVALFDSFLKRRKNFEPVAYIANEKAFFEDVFFVDRDVLIPRPETEFVLIEAISYLKKRKSKSGRPAEVLDICCGCGCIGLTLLNFVDCRLTASDISEKALNVAKINLKRLFKESREVKFIKSDLFEKIEGSYDLITANPPYLSLDDMRKFVVRDLKFEPEIALYGGNRGFEISERIIKSSPERLNPGGFLIIELGYEGTKFVQALQTEMKLVKIVKDYNDIGRVAVFER